MTKTVMNIYQTRIKSRFLTDIGMDVQNRSRSILAAARPALSLSLYGLVATALFFAIVSLNPTYLYQLMPALAIIGMALLLRALSVPIQSRSSKSDK